MNDSLIWKLKKLKYDFKTPISSLTKFSAFPSAHERKYAVSMFFLVFLVNVT